MPRFPKKEAEIQPLAMSIVLGLWNNQSVYPNPPVDIFTLAGKINLYINAHYCPVITRIMTIG